MVGERKEEETSMEDDRDEVYKGNKTRFRGEEGAIGHHQVYSNSGLGTFKAFKAKVVTHECRLHTYMALEPSASTAI